MELGRYWEVIIPQFCYLWRLICRRRTSGKILNKYDRVSKKNVRHQVRKRHQGY